MKATAMVLVILTLMACGRGKQDEPASRKKVVCADSVEQEMFDQEGNSFIVKVPGKCDTVEVQDEAN